jgi:diguanylate cyclase (GGDEF)-like protein
VTDGAGHTRPAAALPARRAAFGPLGILADRAHAAHLAGQQEEARRICAAALAVAEPAGDAVTSRHLRHIGCLSIEDESRWPELHAASLRLLDGLEADAGTDWRATGLALLSHALLQLGRTTEALEPLAEGYELVAGRPQPAPHEWYDRGTACRAIAFPLFRALLFEPAVGLVETSARLSAGHPDREALDGLLLCNVHSLWALFLGLVRRQDEAGRHYRDVASQAVRSAARARAAGDAAGVAAGEAYLQLALQRLGNATVDEQALGSWALAPSGGRERLPARLALASAARRRGELGTARALVEAVAADATAWGEPVCVWVAQAWLAQLDEIRDGATATGRAWQAVAVARLERLWQERTIWFDALVARQRVTELSARVAVDDRQLWEDALTGVANRRLLDATLAAPDRASRPCVFVDVDRFKAVNDEHGHEVGDAVLVAVADILRGLSRADDVVARYGGDEFCAVLSEGADPEAFTARLRAAVATWPWEQVSAGLRVTVSTGYASGPDAFARADLALRDVKARRPAVGMPVLVPPGSSCVPSGPPPGPAPAAAGSRPAAGAVVAVGS